MIEILPSVVSVYLPSSLKWDEIITYAHALVQKGMGIIWDFSFPISSRQPDQMVIKSWEYTLEHFKQALLPLFEKETKGVILYKGSVTFGGHTSWMPEDEENFTLFLEGKPSTALRKKLYCRDQGFQRLKELAPCLPDTIPLYLLFDTPDLALAEYSYDYFRIGVKGAPFGLCVWNWDGQTLMKSDYVMTTGLVLPHMIELEESDIAMISAHLSKHPQCRLIPEALLTQEWHGLDTLFVLPSHVTFQGRRKVNGFVAAGGSVLDLHI